MPDRPFAEFVLVLPYRQVSFGDNGIESSGPVRPIGKLLFDRSKVADRLLEFGIEGPEVVDPIQKILFQQRLLLFIGRHRSRLVLESVA